MVHALAIVAEVRPFPFYPWFPERLAVYTLAIVAELRAPTMDALAMRLSPDHTAALRIHHPRPRATTPPAPDPARQAPQPPARHLRITPVWLPHEAGQRVVAPGQQSQMPGMEIGFGDIVARCLSGLLRVHLDRAQGVHEV